MNPVSCYFVGHASGRGMMARASGWSVQRSGSMDIRRAAACLEKADTSVAANRQCKPDVITWSYRRLG